MFRSVQSHVVACWCAAILGVSLVTAGIVFVAAGIWLIAILGSWYYLIAGIGMIAAGVMMIRRKLGSVPICFAIWDVHRSLRSFKGPPRRLA